MRSDRLPTVLGQGRSCFCKQDGTSIRSLGGQRFGRRKARLTSPEAIGCCVHDAPSRPLQLRVPCKDGIHDARLLPAPCRPPARRAAGSANRRPARAGPRREFRSWPTRPAGGGGSVARRGTAMSDRRAATQAGSDARAKPRQFRAAGSPGFGRPPENAGNRETNLYHCSSCERLARRASATGAPCEFCGGALHPIWGLGQLAARRDDCDASAPQALAIPVGEVARGGPTAARRGTPGSTPTPPAAGTGPSSRGVVSSRFGFSPVGVAGSVPTKPRR